MFSTKRWELRLRDSDSTKASQLKKKSQSIEISASGYDPLPSAAQHALQPTKPTALNNTTTSEEEQKNTANSQRRNPRKGELKRYYTIDTGQKKTIDKKDGRRMSFQKPKGTIEYIVESRDSLNTVALKFDTTPNELVQLNKLFSRAVVPGQVLYVPDPEYLSSVESSPSLSPESPLSPTSSEAEAEKTADSDGTQKKETTSIPAYPCVRSTRVVSSTSEEEEAFTEKFLKINCKYITSNKGTVTGVLLVTPNNIMFDPYKTDPLVQQNGCEEYGIMCPMEEVMSAAMYKDADGKMQDSLPIDVGQLSVKDLCHFKKITRSNTDEMELRMRDTGNDSASTAPRSTEESLSEDVFTESELSPIREELLDDLRQDKSSGASSESVQTVNHAVGEYIKDISDSANIGDVNSSGEQPLNNDSASVNEAVDSKAADKAIKGVQNIETCQEPIEGNIPENEQHLDSEKTDSQKEATNEEETVKLPTQDSETDTEMLRKLWKSHTMQQAKQQRDNIHREVHKEMKHKMATIDGTIEGSLIKEKRRHRLYKFLCLKVGKPMRKTFVSQASALMQQYAQRDKKHEYWFAVPSERTEHLYAFFVQWSPEIYTEDTGESNREPGFIVVKKIETQSGEDSINETAVKEWEVVSVAEYHRRIDALISEELRTLCRRLKITTREDTYSKQGTTIKTELEPEAFRPNLSDPSELLQLDQIEKLTKQLPPRTIGYPWTLVYSTAKHGMSLKTLYRTMAGLDTPVLLVIKDSDGQIFGALASEPFKVSDGFYGTGETFLFTFCPEFEVFKWTGDNMFFLKGDMDALAFGGGGGEFALWLDGDLYHGRSHSCKTFGNRTLSKKEDFIIQDIEIWGFE
ncbi:oxidation resistance protein 1 isoform X1 [Crotalus tigris]|uniref:oxidation resistance protein 1 isoform X1 n=1 Tax=Crotalus tigris TaxID=88082 RepID=UPI00192FA384|nr:oxidation resistance protein 1 isoform X1 [Crotalus tigris]